MLTSTASIHIHARPERVAALYGDAARWPAIFPATIRGTRVIRDGANEKLIEVDHIEGRVVNLLRPRSPTEYELQEYKRRYEATFTNSFRPEQDGTRYELTARLQLKWPYRLLGPLVGPVVRKRMRRFVLEPMKAAAERRDGQRRPR